MEQTKLISFIEAVLNIGSGMILSAIVWMLIGPLFGYVITWGGAFGFASIFTVVSLLRSYVWRRLFTRHLDKWLHRRLYDDTV